MTLDVARIRKDFPILERKVHGVPLVYLDNAATSQKPRQVIDALVHYYENYNANIHRAVHTLGEEATAAYEGAREKVRAFVNAPSAESVIFTRNTTEAINLVAYSWGRANIGEGDEILLTQMEHHSNLIPWQQLAKEKGATVRYVPVTPQGTLELNGLENLFDARTKMMALPHVSNSLGTINPVEKIAAEARRRGVMLLVDGAQGAPHLPVDVQAIGADFYAFSAHKMLGPTGVGVLYGRRELLEEMEPFLGGGEMIRKVTFEGATWNDLPWKFEAGTPNIADVIAFGAAIDYLSDLGWTTSASTRPRSPPTPSTAWAQYPASSSTARRTPRSVAASSRSTSRASTRTTSAPCWTRTASPSAPGTTARSR